MEIEELKHQRELNHIMRVYTKKFESLSEARRDAVLIIGIKEGNLEPIYGVQRDYEILDRYFKYWKQTEKYFNALKAELSKDHVYKPESFHKPDDTIETYTKEFDNLSHAHMSISLLFCCKIGKGPRVYTEEQEKRMLDQYMKSRQIVEYCFDKLKNRLFPFHTYNALFINQEDIINKNK